MISMNRSTMESRPYEFLLIDYILLFVIVETPVFTHTQRAFPFSLFSNLLKTSRLPIESALKILLFCLKLCETLRTGRKQLCSRGNQRDLKALTGRERKHRLDRRTNRPKTDRGWGKGRQDSAPTAPPLPTCPSGLVQPSRWPLCTAFTFLCNGSSGSSARRGAVSCRPGIEFK